jgi:hypothetical protein
MRHGVLEQDFALLEQRPPEEIVRGITGRFWTANGGLVATDAATFRDSPPAGLARAAWSFRLEAPDPATTLLTTETRIRCADGATRASFRRYWRVIRPGSGLIRRMMLRDIRRRAEAREG